MNTITIKYSAQFLFKMAEGSKSIFDDPPIGIDLGTTFSCIAVYRKDKAEIIPDQNGDRLVPSVVFYDPENRNRILVGKAAEDESPRRIENCIRDSKRIIGRKFDDCFVQEYIFREDVQYKLEKGLYDKAVFKVNINNESITKTPEEVSAEILKHLKEMAEAFLNQKVFKVVISVPANFSNAQRKATKKAVDLAGLSLIRFISEPSAAGIHYVGDKHVEGNIMVFDWGGGTLDVSLVTVTNKTFEVQIVYGDTSLGGRDFDNQLFQHFHKKHVEKERSINKLRKACIKLKKKLSKNEVAPIFVDGYDNYEDYEITLTKVKFESLNKNLLDRAMNVIINTLDQACFKKNEIKRVLLVGGTTRIPKIKEMIKQFFNNMDLTTDLNPDEAVAAGASLHAFRYKYDQGGVESFAVSEVTPLSLGLETLNGLMLVYIPRNSSLPITKTGTLITIINNQTIMSLPVFEGERLNCLYNNKLGEFDITDLPPKKTGEVNVNISFHLDEDGILTVSATEDSSGKEKKLVVLMEEFRLSNRKVTMCIEDAQKTREEDEIFKEFLTTKQKFKKFCNHILYDIKKINNIEEENVVKQDCNSFLKSILNLNFNEIDELTDLYVALTKRIKPILKKHGLM
ncbi:heat shock 70 kDa protein-like [Diabrotica virgifera virgifera]|uniref:Heat shock 70 kDa protein-like n=1 Tax=Diabrotica virgifera virgifera TaxID=50390 RepID=A0ABM5IKU5_DIAVI|nr:heat shock 70 kDa protein-like [Diabrotica virgifera virgifera]